MNNVCFIEVLVVLLFGTIKPDIRAVGYLSRYEVDRVHAC